MSRFAFQRIIFVGAVVFGAQFLGQAQITTTLQSAVTSAVVGVTGGETIQLHVFNLQEASASAKPVATACEVTLEIYNASNDTVLAPLSPAPQPIGPAGVLTLSYPVSSAVAIRARRGGELHGHPRWQ